MVFAVVVLARILLYFHWYGNSPPTYLALVDPKMSVKYWLRPPCTLHTDYAPHVLYHTYIGQCISF